MDLLKDDVKTLYNKYLVPSLVAAAVHSIYCFADVIAIGRGIGPEGAAAVSLTAPIFNTLSFIGTVFGIGGAVHFARARGEGQMKKADSYFGGSLFIICAITIILWALVLIFSEPFYRFLGTTPSLMECVSEYTDCILWAVPMFIMVAYLSSFIRSDGAPGLVMKSMFIGGGFNVFADWLFVFPLDGGMFGAAMATVMGISIQCIILLTYFFTKQCKLRVAKPFNLFKTSFRVVSAGFSAGIISVAMAILTIILNKQILHYGNETGLAVFSVVLMCSTMFQYLFTGVGQAIQPIISTNYGAKLMDRISLTNRISYKTTIFMGILFTAIGMLFPVQITCLIVDATPEMIEMAPSIFYVYFLAFIPIGLNIHGTYYLQSVMKTKESLFVSLLRGFILSSVLVFVLPVFLELSGVWWAIVTTEIITAIVAFAIIKSTKQKN